MMTSIKVACVIGLIGLSTVGRAQNRQSRTIIGREWATEELQAALKDSSQRQLLSKPSLLIPDSTIAVQVVEPILFRVFSKKNILDQRPYEIYLIDQYWVITGTLRKGWKGGTFLIILDARDSRVIQLTHDK